MKIFLYHTFHSLLEKIQNGLLAFLARELGANEE